jgi:SecD/SecF fusion protein
LGGLSGWLYSTQQFNYGLDVRGGIRFVYQMDLSKLTADQRSNLATVRERLQRILIERASGNLGVGEPNVVQKGADQFVVELPGFTNIDRAREVMGSSARIEFYHAKNVQTRLATFRPFRAVESDDPLQPIVRFERATGAGATIEPGTAEYANVIRGWDLILSGEDLARAEPQLEGTTYRPLMIFSGEGSRKMESWSRRFVNRGENIAAVLDGRVLSLNPVQDNTVLRDNAVIQGSFPVQYVRNLTALLNAGALPVDLDILSSETIDPTIGATALNQMVTAGIAAFGLIVLFLLGYYAFPGFVALIALCLYVLFTLTVLKLINATFSLAAIAGFILSVGMAVDANILVFERFKEEMKSGRTLQSAINLGFNRALPAIIDSNACTILTSIVLVNIGTGPVKGFATTLIIGVAISLFTAVFVTRSLLLFLVGSGIGTNEKYYALGRNWFGERFEVTADKAPLRIVESSRKWFIISLITVVVGLPFMFIGGLKPNVEFLGGSEAVFSLEGSNLQPAQIRDNMERAGFRGTNVKLGSVSPQNVSILVPANDKLRSLTTDDAKTAAIAEGAGLGGSLAVNATTDEDGAFVVTLPSAANLTATTITRNLEAAGFPNSTATLLQAGAAQRVAYITVPPNKAITELATESDKLDAIAKASGVERARAKGYTEIGPSVQQEAIRNAILGVVVSSALIILYLAFRFGIGLGGFSGGIRFGLSAIGALIHDVLVVVGITAIVGYFFGWEISALFITSMLTVIGFSVHDTIVIFDRVRENLRKPLPNEDFAHLVNRSVSQSFARSINTSMTVIATLIILIVFGTATPDLKLFCVTMLAGIVSGTYSSIYNASPILYLWDKMVMRKKGDQFTLVGIARQEALKHEVIATRGVAVPEIALNPNGSEPPQPQQPGTRSYGQVKRRASGNPTKRVDPDDL